MLLNISKKTKIVATIGPASDTPEMVLALYKAGMNVMRINFSHGDYPEQLKKIYALLHSYGVEECEPNVPMMLLELITSI